MSQTATPHQIVILGAGYAGLYAAFRLANRLPRETAQITLISASPDFVERIRLHQVVAGQTIRHRSVESLLRRTPIRFILGRVTQLAPDQNTVHIEQAGTNTDLHYDTLIYALGSVTDRARVPGVAAHTYGLDAVQSQDLTRRLAEAQSGTHVVIVGSGATGIEAATEIAEQFPHLHIEMVSSTPLGNAFSKGGERYLRSVFEKLHITLHEDLRVQQVEAGKLVLVQGGEVLFDVCIWAAGLSVSGLARSAGLTVNPTGQIIVDETLRSVSHPNIYAVGDSATLEAEPNLLRMACATAIPMGCHAADVLSDQLLGCTPQPFRFAYMLRCYSLGRQRGLVQMVDGHDRPIDRIFTGVIGKLVKESICQSTVLAMLGERRISPFYQWPKPAIVSPDKVIQRNHA